MPGGLLTEWLSFTSWVAIFARSLALYPVSCAWMDVFSEASSGLGAGITDEEPTSTSTAITIRMTAMINSGVRRLSSITGSVKEVYVVAN